MTHAHTARGQAVFETALAIPLFLLAFFALLWAMRDSSLAERVQLGVRYTGMVQTLADPYTSFSLYTMYATVDNNSPAQPQLCFPGDSGTVSQGHAVFWQPKAVAPTLPSCLGGSKMINGPESYSQPILLRYDYATLTAQATVDNLLQTAVLGTATTQVQAAQNFFQSPDVGTLLTCSTLGPAVKTSLEALNDTTTPTNAASPLPTNVTAVPVMNTSITSSNCATPADPQFAQPSSPY